MFGDKGKGPPKNPLRDMKNKHLQLALVLTALLFSFSLFAFNKHISLEDPYADIYTTVQQDTIPELKERFGDFLNDQPANPFDLQDPKIIEKEVEYDPETGNYIIYERIGNDYFRAPTYMTFEEYMEYRKKKEEQEYFQQLSGISRGKDGLSAIDPIAKFDVEKTIIDRLFGGNTVEIRPQGGVDLTFGFNYSRTDNPLLLQRQSRIFSPNFDMDIQMNVTGKIGEKLNLNTNYNTNATFNFDNQIKLAYDSDLFNEDDIVKKIEAGNVTLPLRGQLIQGAESLFGLKTELQFGHLRLTAIAAQQNSERENILLEGGAALQEFEVRADEYDENRHFFLSHYNRAVFESSLDSLPIIQSLFNLENIEVWVTNDRNEVDDVRDIIALADLGEPVELVNPENVERFPDPIYREICDGEPLPDNRANKLYEEILARGDRIRSIDQAVAILQSSEFGLVQTRDFEKVSARKLRPSEYTVHPQLGFISLNINLRPDQVLAVGYNYTYNSRPLAVGEIANNFDNNNTDEDNPIPEVIFVKMLKSTTQQTDIPTWDLMMKNVYPIGAFRVGQEDFELDIYYEDPGGGNKRFLPETNLAGVPLIRIFNLDNLNSQRDPQPDGRFDFVPGLTILPENGRIIFPVLEPFGSSLARRITDPRLREQYTYQELYDQTIFQAREFPEKNRFIIKGEFKSSTSSEISLGGFNIPQGSVTVTAGGQKLREGFDYEIDYAIGRLRILNDALLNANVPINVSYEDNSLFGFQNKTMLGLRADYELDDNFQLGATFMQLFERPFTPKVNLGEDPINNKMYGLDVNYSREAPWLTKIVDGIPGLQTSAPSNIAFTAEAAALRPGHARAINQNRQDRGGVVYIDDFEGSSNSLTLSVAVINDWKLASVPQNDLENNNPLFPEAALINDVRGGANRAQLSWYNIIDRNARGRFGTADNPADGGNIYTSLVRQEEVFPNRQLPQNQLTNIQTFDVIYTPFERGQYNFDVPEGYPGISSGLEVDNAGDIRLKDPETRWAGIMRQMRNADFQAANVEFLEFWLLSPFLDPTNPNAPSQNFEGQQGELYFNFGNVSEDILRDSRKSFENGLPSEINDRVKTNLTNWARIPVSQELNNAFDAREEAREDQDLGLDGLDNAGERVQFQDYIQSISRVSAIAGTQVSEDPANDDFVPFSDYTNEANALERYSRYNGTQGNSQSSLGENVQRTGTNRPDSEDINGDKTMNEAESYFQYRIPIFYNPADPREIDRERTPYITDRRIDNRTGRIWYRFRLPIQGDDKVAVGGIQDFRSIRFMRMFFKGFEEQTIFRFAQMELVRNQWRRYMQDLSDIGAGLDECEQEPVFEVDAVNIEENSERTPFNYVLPEGIQREQTIGAFSALQNEQSISVRVEGLCDGDEKGVFRNLDRDFRVYERIKMFVHAEEVNNLEVPEGALNLFLRFGSDFQNNYYEYELPLVMSDPEVIESLQSNTSRYRQEVWRPENEIDLELRELVNIKTMRNQDPNFSLSDEFVVQADSNRVVKIRGNPNFGDVKVLMIGVRNPYNADGASYNVEIWANELRLTGLDERGSVAATARFDAQLADFGSLTLAGNYSSIGFGAINQKVQERSREQILGYDMALNLELGKFFPEKWGLRLPLYAQLSNITKNPEFDPYDFDIRLKDKLNSAESQTQRDSIKRLAQDVVNIKTINLTNVRKDRTDPQKKPMPWDIENFSASYSFTETERRDPLISLDEEKQHTGSIDYSFSRKVTYIEPLKGLNAKPLRFFQQFNFNPLPNSFDFSTVVTRRFATTSYRFTDLDPRFTTFFTKRFNWDRDYNVQWDMAKSLKFNFNALVGTVIDEPDEILEDENGVPFRITDQFRRDSIWNNLRDFGRIKNYRHNFNISYNLPIRYLPLMDWVQVRANYTADYSWTAAPLNAEFLGNVIQNNQSRRLTADLNFERLYGNIPFLKKFNNTSNRRRSNTRIRRSSARDRNSKDDSQNGKRNDNELSTFEKIFIRPLLLVRKGRVNYDESFSTLIPGFTPQPTLLGMSKGFGAPGWAFVAGLQPDIRELQVDDPRRTDKSLGYLEKNSDWITTDVRLNQQVIQSYNQRINADLTLEPFNDFRIDLELSKDYQESNSQFFKDTLKNDGIVNFTHGTPQVAGSTTISFSALKTLLNGRGFGINEEYFAELFDRFDRYRVIISNRLGSGTHADDELADKGYAAGYGRAQQDVLVPAFIAAYTEQDPNDVSLDLFDEMPRVNWRFTYDGLSRLPLFRDLFEDFSITHSYRSSLTVNSFFTELKWLNTGGTGLTPKNEFFPRITIPDIAFQEGFAPFVAVTANTQNGMSFSVDYNRSRILALNLDGKQLSETQSKEIIIGFGYLMQNVELGFLKGKRSRKRQDEEEDPQQPPTPAGRNAQLQGKDLDINFDFSIRDDIVYNTFLNKSQDFLPTRGSYNLSFSPSAEYQISRQLSLRLFFDYQRIVPKSTNGFPRTTSAGGVVVRFQLN